MEKKWEKEEIKEAEARKSEIYSRFYDAKKFGLDENLIKDIRAELEKQMKDVIVEQGKTWLKEQIRENPESFPQLAGKDIKGLDEMVILSNVQNKEKFWSLLDEENMEWQRIKELIGDVEYFGENTPPDRKAMIFERFPDGPVREKIWGKINGETLDQKAKTEAGVGEKDQWVAERMEKAFGEKDDYIKRELENVKLSEHLKSALPERWKKWEEWWENERNKEKYHNSFEEYINRVVLEDSYNRRIVDKEMEKFKEKFTGEVLKQPGLSEEDFYAILEAGYDPREIKMGFLGRSVITKEEGKINFKDFIKRVHGKQEEKISGWHKELEDKWENVKKAMEDKWEEILKK